jgi:DNA-binding GntR family transcriptional regulator
MDQFSLHIDRVIVDAILAGRLQPGARLGEQALATLFEVSRTTVREALIRLSRPAAPSRRACCAAWASSSRG